MKPVPTFLVCLITSIFILTSCKKEDCNPSSVFNGTWELRKASGSFALPISYPSGNGNILKFNDGTYEKYVNGVLDKSGVYEIVADPTVMQNTCLNIAEGRYTNRIIYDANNTDSKIFLEISGNKLSFISGCYAVDAGHELEYRKE